MSHRGGNHDAAIASNTCRRRLLQAVGTSGLLALAGCSGGDDDGTTDPDEDGSSDGGGDGTDDGDSDGTGDGDGEPVTNKFVEPNPANPTDWQHNPYNLASPFLHALQNDQFNQYNIETDEFTERALEVVEYDGDTALVEYAERTWHETGEPVTEDDLYAKFALDTINGVTYTKLFSEINRAGERQVELTLDGNVQREIFNHGLTNQWLTTPIRKYQEYIDRYEDGEALGDINADLTSATFDEPHGHGPFQFVEKTENRYRMELVEDHPDAENIDFQYWDVERHSADMANNLQGGDIDGVRNYTPRESFLNAMQSDYSIAQLPAMWGNSLPFNCSHEDYGNIRVRQAIAEFIDREQVATAYGPYGQPVQKPSGLVGNIDGENNQSDSWQRWVTDDAAEQLYAYNDPERGRALLEAEGYSKDDGTWYKPNGDQLSATIKVPADTTDWLPVYRTVSQQLSGEGIDSTIQPIQDTVYWGQHFLAGNHVMAATGWTLQNPQPWYTADQYFNIDAGFMNFDPSELEVPPMGEPDGELQSVDPLAKLEELKTATGDDAQQIAGEVAWIVNQAIPMLPLTEINDTVWFNDDNYTVPDPSENLTMYQSKWPLWWFTRDGDLQVKTE